MYVSVDCLHVCKYISMYVCVQMCMYASRYVRMYVCTGASIAPEAMVHFHPFSDFPCFRKNISDWTRRKISPILPFPRKFSDFHPPKFLTTFFSHSSQISNFPLFSLFQVISPLFREMFLFPPTFAKFPL